MWKTDIFIWRDIFVNIKTNFVIELTQKEIHGFRDSVPVVKCIVVTRIRKNFEQKRKKKKVKLDWFYEWFISTCNVKGLEEVEKLGKNEYSLLTKITRDEWLY